MKNFQLNFITDKSKLRLVQILNAFELHTNCSTSFLAKRTETSTRTIIRDIQFLSDYFGSSICIDSDTTGYTFHLLLSEEYTENKRNLLKNEPLFILFESLFLGEIHELTFWSEKLHIGRSSLIRHLSSIVEKQLNGFRLSLSLDPIAFIGSEADIRHFYQTFYYEAEITPHTILPSIGAQQAVIDITALIQMSKTQFSSFGFFSYFLYLTVERSRIGCSITLSPELKKIILTDPGFQQFYQANEIIESYFNFLLSEEELMYIYFVIITRRKINDLQLEKEFCANYNHWPEIKTLSNFIYKFIKEPSSIEFRDQILLESFFTVTKLRSILSTVANKNMGDFNHFVQENYPQDFQSNLTILEQYPNINNLYPADYLVDICANLTLFIESIKEEHWGIWKNIAFVLEGNEYVCLHVEALAKKYFGRFQELYFPDSNELTPEYINEYKIDLVVTNYSEYLTQYDFNTEILLFKSIPDASDWNRLLEKINPKIIQNFSLVNNHL